MIHVGAYDRSVTISIKVFKFHADTTHLADLRPTVPALCVQRFRSLLGKHSKALNRLLLKRLYLQIRARSSAWLERTADNREVWGSKPRGPTNAFRLAIKRACTRAGRSVGRSPRSQRGDFTSSRLELQAPGSSERKVTFPSETPGRSTMT